MNMKMINFLKYSIFLLIWCGNLNNLFAKDQDIQPIGIMNEEANFQSHENSKVLLQNADLVITMDPNQIGRAHV